MGKYGQCARQFFVPSHPPPPTHGPGVEMLQIVPLYLLGGPSSEFFLLQNVNKSPVPSSHLYFAIVQQPEDRRYTEGSIRARYARLITETISQISFLPLHPAAWWRREIILVNLHPIFHHQQFGTEN